MTGDCLVRPMLRGDVKDVVEIHRAGFAGFFLTSLGRPFLRTYYSSVVRDADSIALVCERQGTITGFVVGSANPRGFYRRMLRRRWPAFACAAVPGVLRRPSAAVRVVRALRHPSRQEEGAHVAGLYSIVVDPHSQGVGMGAQLIDAFCAAAAQRGMTDVRLETDAEDNDFVRHFYERAGFVITAECVTPESRTMVTYGKRLESGDGS